jgi:hypothetical protein
MFPFLNGGDDVDRVSGFFDVMNPNYLYGAARHGVTDGGQGAGQPPFDGPIVQQSADKTFP